jgi:hypothetical protein
VNGHHRKSRAIISLKTGQLHSNFERGGASHFPIAMHMDSATLSNADQSSPIPMGQATAQPSPFQTNLARFGFPDRAPPAVIGVEAVALSPFVRRFVRSRFVVCESSVGSLQSIFLGLRTQSGGPRSCRLVFLGCTKAGICPPLPRLTFDGLEVGLNRSTV